MIVGLSCFIGIARSGGDVLPRLKSFLDRALNRPISPIQKDQYAKEACFWLDLIDWR